MVPSVSQAEEEVMTAAICHKLQTVRKILIYRHFLLKKVCQINVFKLRFLLGEIPNPNAGKLKTQRNKKKESKRHKRRKRSGSLFFLLDNCSAWFWSQAAWRRSGTPVWTVCPASWSGSPPTPAAGRSPQRAAHLRGPSRLRPRRAAETQTWSIRFFRGPVQTHIPADSPPNNNGEISYLLKFINYK